MKGLNRRARMAGSKVNDKTELEISYGSFRRGARRSLRSLSSSSLCRIYGEAVSLKNHPSREEITTDSVKEEERGLEKRGGETDNKMIAIGVLYRCVACARIYIDDRKGCHFLWDHSRILRKDERSEKNAYFLREPRDMSKNLILRNRSAIKPSIVQRMCMCAYACTCPCLVTSCHKVFHTLEYDANVAKVVRSRIRYSDSCGLKMDLTKRSVYLI